MQDLARPKLLGRAIAEPAWASVSRRKSARPSPQSPRLPARNMSRRVSPLHSFLADPRTRSIAPLPGARARANSGSDASIEAAAQHTDLTASIQMVRLGGTGEFEHVLAARVTPGTEVLHRKR